MRAVGIIRKLQFTEVGQRRVQGGHHPKQGWEDCPWLLRRAAWVAFRYVQVSRCQMMRASAKHD
eukprot:11814039-Alexandrium_andersonii.AAC.1